MVLFGHSQRARTRVSEKDQEGGQGAGSRILIRKITRVQNEDLGSGSTLNCRRYHMYQEDSQREPGRIMVPCPYSTGRVWELHQALGILRGLEEPLIISERL